MNNSISEQEILTLVAAVGKILMHARINTNAQMDVLTCVLAMVVGKSDTSDDEAAVILKKNAEVAAALVRQYRRTRSKPN